MAEEVQIFLADTSSNLIDGVYVGLHNSSTKALLQSAVSGAGVQTVGQVIFSAVDETLNSGVYEIRVVPATPAAVTAGKVQNITVLAAPAAPLSNIFDVSLTIPSLPQATNAQLCRCSGYFHDMTGKPLKGVSIHFTDSRIPQIQFEANASNGYESIGVIGSKRVVTTDTNGYAVVDLYRGGKYVVFLEGYQSTAWTIEVPDLTAANLVDTLFPAVGSVTYTDDGTQITPAASPATTATIDVEKEITVAVFLRTGIATTEGEVTFTSSDTDVLTVEYASAVLKLTGVSAGSATVEVVATVPEESYNGIKFSTIPSISADLTVTVS